MVWQWNSTEIFGINIILVDSSGCRFARIRNKIILVIWISAGREINYRTEAH